VTHPGEHGILALPTRDHAWPVTVVKMGEPRANDDDRRTLLEDVQEHRVNLGLPTLSPPASDGVEFVVICGRVLFVGARKSTGAFFA